MAVRALPEGFVERVDGAVRLLCDASLEAPLLAVGVLRGAPAERWGVPLPSVGGGRRPLAAVRVPGVDRPLLVKELRRGGWLGPLLGRACSPSRAFEELLAVATLRRAGVPMPPILAARLTRTTPWPAPVVVELVVEFREQGRDLERWLRGNPPPRERARVLAAAGAAVARLHRAGVLHEDLNVRNLLVLDDGSVELLDLGRCRSLRADAVGRARNLARLYRSARKRGLLPAYASAADAARFLEGYDRAEWRAWFAAARRAYERTAAFHRASWRAERALGRAPA